MVAAIFVSCCIITIQTKFMYSRRIAGYCIRLLLLLGDLTRLAKLNIWCLRPLIDAIS